MKIVQNWILQLEKAQKITLKQDTKDKKEEKIKDDMLCKVCAT